MMAIMMKYPIYLLACCFAYGQSVPRLLPLDAATLLERSQLFTSRVQDSCPSVSVGTVGNELAHARLEDHCQDSVSGLVGDYTVNLTTGEVRRDDNQVVVIAAESLVW